MFSVVLPRYHNMVAMYQTLIYLHSVTRWAVLLALLYSIYRSYKGRKGNKPFTNTDDAARHWTATIAHVQLLLGIILYSQSPVIKYFWSNFADASRNMDTLFFGLIHMTLMLSAIVMITIASALSKRSATNKEKFRIILLWYSIALGVIFVAIPWPFSPLVNRPYIR